jgi:hypothetical protein
MTSHRQRRVLRRALGGFAVAALLAGAAVPAMADEITPQGDPLPVTIHGPEDIELTMGDDASSVEAELTLLVPGEEEPDESGITYPVHQGDYSVTIDASDLAGVAEVTLPCSGGPVAVCTGYELYPVTDVVNNGWRNRLGDLELTAAEGAAPGASGTIVVTGEGAGLEFTELRISVLVGVASFKVLPLSEPAGFAAGDIYKPLLGFRHQGGLDADGVIMRIGLSRGLSFGERYSNCEYARSETYSRPKTRALCYFEGPFQAGIAHDLAERIAVPSADFALQDEIVYSVMEDTPSHRADVRGEDSWTFGEGRELTLAEATGSSAEYPSRFGETPLATGGFADLAFTGDEASGAAGDTVELTLTLANRGPGWIGALRSLEPMSFEVGIPEGATVITPAENCYNWNNGPQYVCWTDTPFNENAEVGFTFEYRIDEVIENATATAEMYAGPSDPDHANNIGHLVLNPTEDTDPADPADAGGTTGDTGETGATTGGPKPDLGGSDELADTGSGDLLTAIGGGLLLFGAGAGVLWFRRRIATAAV